MPINERNPARPLFSEHVRLIDYISSGRVPGCVKLIGPVTNEPYDFYEGMIDDLINYKLIEITTFLNLKAMSGKLLFVEYGNITHQGKL